GEDEEGPGNAAGEGGEGHGVTTEQGRVQGQRDNHRAAAWHSADLRWFTSGATAKHRGGAANKASPPTTAGPVGIGRTGVGPRAGQGRGPPAVLYAFVNMS